MHLELWQWALACLGAFLVGLSKTGIAGLGVLSVALFALILPARESVGVVLVVLLCADVVAVTAYRREANWRHLARLFPWTAAGIVLGYLVVGRIDDTQVRRLIGAILLAITIVHVIRRARRRAAVQVEDQPQSIWFAPLVGIVAGFTTMVANAAGPIMILYLLAMGLPKIEFMGTSAWFFFSANLFKVPFSYALGLIDFGSLSVDLPLIPFAIVGALFGRAIVRLIDQRVFEALALLLTTVAAVRLLL
jgi:uncharacterized membrane protein YfcA